MAANAVVGREEEAVLLVAVGIGAHRGVLVDVQRAAHGQLAFGQLDQVDRLAIAVELGDLAVAQEIRRRFEAEGIAIRSFVDKA